MQVKLVKRASRTPEERFWKFVDKKADCWLWHGSRTADGYGLFRLSSQGLIRAHRYSYSQAFGEISEGLVIDHLCRTRACVNPSHMEVVTNLENVRRGRMVGQTWAVGEKHGMAKLTEEDVRKIRRLFCSSDVSQVALAKEFKVTKSTISYIVRGKTWRRLDTTGSVL